MRRARQFTIEALLAFGGLGLLLAPPTAAQNFNQPAELVPDDDARFTTPGRATRQLQQAREDIAGKRYSDGVRRLQQILDNDEDFFQRRPDDGDGTRGIKAAVDEILAGLPQEGREAYEAEFGGVARGLLETAGPQNRREILEEVARRYFYTDAGLEAAYRLGTHHLDRGSAIAAALCLERLRAVPERSRRWEPVLALKTALAWGQAGLPDKSEPILQELRRNSPEAELALGGRSLPIFDENGRLTAAVREALERGAERTALPVDAWLLFGGDPARNAESGPALPLVEAGWQAHTLVDPRDPEQAELLPLVEGEFQELKKQSEYEGTPLLPAMHPLVTGNMAVFRTLYHVQAVDLDTGALLWQSVTTDPLPGSLAEPSRPELPGAPSTGRRSAADQLAERVWRNVTEGTLSSDGERVYFVEAGGAREADDELRPFMNRRFTTEIPANRLLAIELATGKLQWEVGGSREEYPLALAGASFLGPPLPLSGILYALAEDNGDVRLLALDPVTGALDWSQSLTGSGRELQAMSFRHLWGVSPSYGDGVLVCPTADGNVVAVDLTLRRLLWSYRYIDAGPPTGLSQEDRFRVLMAQRGMAGSFSSFAADDAHWVDSPCVIAGSRVLLTPRDADVLLCLNLVDGQPLWSIPRGQGLFLACVQGDRVVVVGRNEVQAYRLDDGKPAWSQSTPIPLPGGRGYRTGSQYRLPLSTGEIISLDLADGRILARTMLPDGRIPGNLAVAGDTAISQTAEQLFAFMPTTELRNQVERRLAASGTDPEALALRGSIRLHEAQLQDGLADLREAVASGQDPAARRQLVGALMEGLRLDFKTFRAYAGEIDRLATDPADRATFRRMYADGLQRSGETAAAFEQYLKLAGADAGEPWMEPIGGSLQVRSDRWAGARVAELYAAASSELQTAMSGQIADEFTRISADHGGDAALRFLKAVGGEFLPSQARVQALQNLGDTEPIVLEQQLISLLDSGDPAASGFATARLVELLFSHDRAHETEHLLHLLETRYSAQVCLDGRRGSELAAQWRARPERAAAEPTPQWPVAPFDVREQSQRGVPRKQYALDFEELHGGRYFPNWSADMILGDDSIIAWDAGHRQQWVLEPEDWRVANDEPGRLVPGAPENGVRTLGHLAVVLLRDRFLVVDTLQVEEQKTTRVPRPRVLWTQPLFESGTPHGSQARFQLNGGMFGGRGIPAMDRYGRPLGTLGVVTPELLCFQAGGSLYAVDPLSGPEDPRPYWVRKNVERGAEIFGDEQFIFVLENGHRTVSVLRGSDGVEIDSIPAERVARRVVTRGHHALLAVPSQGYRREYRNLVTDELVWALDAPAGSVSTIVDGNELATLEPNGRLTVRAVETGELLLESRLEVAGGANSIVVFKHPQRYVVLTETDRSLQVSRSTARVNGPAFGVDRTSGAVLWTAQIDEQAIERNHPSHLPVLVFSNRAAVNIGNNNFNRGPTTVSTLLLLDTRNGRIVFQDRLANRVDRTVTGVYWNLSEPVIEVMTNTGMLSLTFLEAER